LEPVGNGNTQKGRGWFFVFLIAVVAALGFLLGRYLAKPPKAGNSAPPANIAIVQPTMAFKGDPAEATDKLLKALNAKLAEMGLYEPLVQVFTQPATVQGKTFPAYSERIPLPLRYSADQLIDNLIQAAQSLGAQPASKPAVGHGNNGNISYSCSFDYDNEWTPVELVLLEVHAPKVCLIIDDAGYQKGEALKHLYGFKVPVTVSIIPDTQFSKSLAEDFPGHGVEVMCHMPMEGHEKGMVGNAYKELLKKGMASSKVGEELKQALEDLPNCRGLNNHMGSVATVDPELMWDVCQVLKSRNLFIIDSRTTAQSVVEGVAQKAGLPVAHRDIFLDNVESPGAILKQLDLTVAYARKHGIAVAIGHFKLTTLKTLEEAVGPLKDQGIQFVYASEVVK
jgi:uncharacterized protein